MESKWDREGVLTQISDKVVDTGWVLPRRGSLAQVRGVVEDSASGLCPLNTLNAWILGILLIIL